MRNSLCFLCLFSAILCGCVKDTSLDAGLGRKVVVEFVLSDDNPQNLYLSISRNPGEVEAPAVRDADIKLTDVTRSKELNRDIVLDGFVKVSDDRWALDYAGIPGHEYRLEVNINGFDPVYAEQKMPERFELSTAAPGDYGVLPKYVGYGAFYTTDSVPEFLIIKGIKRNKETGEYVGRDLYFRTAYTLSKTDREGFATICDGGKFNARFDRRHMLNVQGRWKGFSLAMTLQSGHWENGAPITYQIHIPGLETDAEYYEGVNNFHMPTVFRLDLGYERSFHSKRAEHSVNIGVCNVTNHFNPFMLYYDAQSEGWKMLALLPVMPNFSWKVEF